VFLTLQFGPCAKVLSNPCLELDQVPDIFENLNARDRIRWVARKVLTLGDIRASNRLCFPCLQPGGVILELGHVEMCRGLKVCRLE
jgi:hypothetical protein